MTLRPLVAYPFQRAGRGTISENDFVAALSLDRGWFDPAAAEQCLERAITEGLLDRSTDGGDGGDGDPEVRATFEYRAVTVPEDLDPDPAVLEPRSVFEACVERLVEAGVEKRAAVAGINQLQDELALALEAAAVLFAHRQGVAVADLAARAREDGFEVS
jgi:hypothetical protein